MAPPSGARNTLSLNFGQLKDEDTKAMYSFSSSPTDSSPLTWIDGKWTRSPSPQARGSAQLSEVDNSTMSDSERESTNMRSTLQGRKRKRSRKVMELDEHDSPTLRDPEHNVQQERFAFSIPPSELAHQLSAKSGLIFGPLLCEMILELMRQGAWPLELLQQHITPVKAEQSTTALTSGPLPFSSALQAAPIVKTPQQHIEDTMHATGHSKQIVLSKYGQGDLDINGLKARFAIMDRGKRCDTCATAKRGM